MTGPWRRGRLNILTSRGERLIRVRRVHLEEDTGKLTHVTHAEDSFSLVDLNRAGVPLLEIVSEPDLRSAEEVLAYAVALRSLLRYLGVNSGDMQKGVLRIEPNVSVHMADDPAFGTRVEIKNLNSFRALERSVGYEIQRQSELLRQGKAVQQETRGWDETRGETFLQRTKEGEDDYRYFPEPDLPPLVLDPAWIEQVGAASPELPFARFRRFQEQYSLGAYDAQVLTADLPVADYFEQAVAAAPQVLPKQIANWISGELFGLMNQAGIEIEACPVGPQALAELVLLVGQGEITQNTGKAVLAEMFASGKTAGDIVAQRGLSQVSDRASIALLVQQVLDDHPEQLAAYLSGKESLLRWLFGQVACGRPRSGQSSGDPARTGKAARRAPFQLKNWTL